MARKKVKGMPRKQQNLVMRKLRIAGSSVKTTGSNITNRMKPRKTQAVDDSINRKYSEIKDEREKRVEYNKKLAVERDHIKKRELKRKIKGSTKKIKRKKREITEAKRRRHEVKYVMNKLHTSDYSEAEMFLNTANSHNVEYNEVDWGELQGADLSNVKKKEILEKQLKKDYT